VKFILRFRREQCITGNCVDVKSDEKQNLLLGRHPSIVFLDDDIQWSLLFVIPSNFFLETQGADSVTNKKPHN
jgi:hypothetical protein